MKDARVTRDIDSKLMVELILLFIIKKVSELEFILFLLFSLIISSLLDIDAI